MPAHGEEGSLAPRAQIDWSAEGDACVSLLQDLIRIETVNRGTDAEDDGNERPAAELLAERMRKVGLEPKLFEKVPRRTSMVVRLKGTGEKPPLLLNAHLDVVEADASKWRHDPFGGEIHDGYVWGRGAIDMKHMAAMSARVMELLARRDGPKLARDVVFAAVADEENGCNKGAYYLVDEHADEIRAEYMLGEIGAFSVNFMGRTLFPIQVAEKGSCWVRATFEGDPGHGSMPNPDSAVLKLARAIAKVGGTRMPIHVTDVVRTYVDRLAATLPLPHRAILGRLKTPQLAGLIVDRLISDPGQRRAFSAMLSNTASPTVVRAGSKTNVIPGSASVEIDGRTLPGQTEESFLAELRELLGKEAKLEVVESAPPVLASPETELYRVLERTVKANDPTGHPLPFMIPGFTDAKAYDRLGTKCYGFSPVRFDPTHDVSFTRMFHGLDERVPVDGLKWGLKVLFEAVISFCG